MLLGVRLEVVVLEEEEAVVVVAAAAAAEDEDDEAIDEVATAVYIENNELPNQL